MVRDYGSLEVLDLSKNDIGNEGAREITRLIDENNTIKRMILRDCKIGSPGLQAICSALCKEENVNLEFLDIRDNPIPDKHLKILLVLLYKSPNVQNIEYSLYDDANIKKRFKLRLRQRMGGAGGLNLLTMS